MELMEGTLKYIADNREFLNIDERRAVALMKPILKFLAFMHDDGYVHADIKPDNILFGNNDIKVGDFGLAVDRRDKTSNIGIRGTVPYMPKELFCGGEYRASVDIYEAAGVWKYLLTGSHPWAGYEAHAVMFKVRRE
ncbi:Stk1 family PASTA domain-containing Ser Thr kinase [Paramuricea clavata]|uniref:Stk1 family PASTA domain-containing Ser Thr kinase n=1 Tax=Paramuricea clavata TaxID=317549 RepID=A0A6S7J2L7_PARCT|nr:Stk1 family PASTA domain-containing Ser Thr kinase [Paramuricea clavata]